MRVQVFSGPIWGRHVAISSINVTRVPITLGRGRTADVSLADHSVSRQHCQLYEVDGGIAVRDLGSRYGTFVNGKRITQAVLRPGGEIRIGRSTVVLSHKPMRGLSVESAHPVAAEAAGH